MQRFLLTSTVVLALAVAIVVGVFVYIQFELARTSEMNAPDTSATLAEPSDLVDQ